MIVVFVGSLAFTRMSRRDLGRRNETRGGSEKMGCSEGDSCSVGRCEWMMCGICDVALLYVTVNVGLCGFLCLRYVSSSDLDFSLGDGICHNVGVIVSSFEVRFQLSEVVCFIFGIGADSPDTECLTIWYASKCVFWVAGCGQEVCM